MNAFVAYLQRVIATGTEESSRRFALVSGSLTFALAITLLCLGAMVGLGLGRDVTGLAAALWPLCLSFGALAGYAYTRGPAPNLPLGATQVPPPPENVATARPAGQDSTRESL